MQRVQEALERERQSVQRVQGALVAEQQLRQKAQSIILVLEAELNAIKARDGGALSSGRSGLDTMESLSAERQEMVTTLMAVAGIEDVEFAREVLQDNGWQLETSVNAYMMMIGAGKQADALNNGGVVPAGTSIPSAASSLTVSAAGVRGVDPRPTLVPDSPNPQCGCGEEDSDGTVTRMTAMTEDSDGTVTRMTAMKQHHLGKTDEAHQRHHQEKVVPSAKQQVVNSDADAPLASKGQHNDGDRVDMLLPTTEDTGNTMPAQQVSADGGGHGWTLEQAIPAGEGEDTLGMVEAEGKGRALEKRACNRPVAGGGGHDSTCHPLQTISEYKSSAAVSRGCLPLAPPVALAPTFGMAPSAINETAFVELVVGIVQRNKGGVLVSLCCDELYARNSEYKAFVKAQGGFKKLCSRHSEKLEFVNGKSGQEIRIPKHQIASPPKHQIASKDLLQQQESEADVNARNKGASTPLHAAAQNDEVECGRMLIRHSADVTAIDLGGGTAQESACKMGKTALAAAGVFHVPPGLNSIYTSSLTGESAAIKAQLRRY